MHTFALADTVTDSVFDDVFYPRLDWLRGKTRKDAIYNAQGLMQLIRIRRAATTLLQEATP